MQQWFVGSTPYLQCSIYDVLGALADPATSIKITIEDPNGTEVVSSESMTQSALYASNTGRYYYASWAITSGALTGIYKWRPETTDSSVIIINQEFCFEVMDR